MTWAENRSEFELKLTEDSLYFTFEDESWDVFCKLKIYHEYCWHNYLCYIRSTLQLSAWTHWDQDEMAFILQWTLKNAFPWMKMFEFRLKFHCNLYLGSNQQYSNIDLDNGLVPNRQQVIIWNNESIGYRCIYAFSRPQWVNWPCHNMTQLYFINFLSQLYLIDYQVSGSACFALTVRWVLVLSSLVRKKFKNVNFFFNVYSFLLVLKVHFNSDQMDKN